MDLAIAIKGQYVLLNLSPPCLCCAWPQAGAEGGLPRGSISCRAFPGDIRGGELRELGCCIPAPFARM